MKKNNMVAMILAGGRGSRLFDLTKKVAKPAVHYGGKYRIIDFPLSNCANSHISTVGVLVQYESVLLSSYSARSSTWGLDSKGGGVYVLSPREKDETGLGLYDGTADAIYQNRDFLDQEEAEYVLVLSGDHIYKMNYEKMLEKHIESKAEATIAVIEVPMKEASRFGIMNTDGAGTIVEFEEKPAKPRSNLASMGVYCFTWKVLREALIKDEQDEESTNDFGKNIIPMLLNSGKKLFAFRFSGYWKDVGTISSLWETNMDILDKPEDINLVDRSWKIFSRNPVKPSHFIGKDGSVKNSALTDGCRIHGDVIHSVLSESVIVEKGAVVKDCVLLPGVVVKEGAHIERCIVDFGTVIGKNVKAGPNIEGEGPYTNHKICSQGISVFERGLVIKDDAVIPGNSMIDSDVVASDEENVIASTFRV